jgi:6-phosphofructokinase 1
MERQRLAILVGGGPAPGINSVIAAATIRARLDDVEVLGIEDGFEWLMQGDASHVRPLTIEGVSRIHFRGGSTLGISRANPTSDPRALDRVVATLRQLGVTELITIGGDDTAFSAMQVHARGGGRIRVAHVPKTIDNDLELPAHVDTFGFQTARHHGVEVVKNMMVDAKTTSRWYYVVAMGRKAGHLALAIGKAAGATITLIPEEFTDKPVPLSRVADTLVGAHLKRLAAGRRDGVAVIAEGVALAVDPRDLDRLENIERDDHGHVRLEELPFGVVLKQAVQQTLGEFGIRSTIGTKTIGYELRCADPIPYDMEYTRDLGYCAAKYLLGGGDAAMVSLQAGEFVPVPFESLVDPVTGRARVRLVDVNTTRYAIARRYMLRLRRDDFEGDERLAPLAAVVKLSVPEFRQRFEYLVADEPPALQLIEPRKRS